MKMRSWNNTNITNVTNDIHVVRCYMTYVVKIPSRSYVVNGVIACAVNFLFVLLGAFLNALVIWIFWKTRRLREKTCYFMIMLLACVDLSVTVIVQPMFSIYSIWEMTANATCFCKMLSQTLSVLLSGMSTMTFFTLNIERYLSIVHTVFHRNHVTKQKCFLFLFVWWLICAVLAFGPLFSFTIDIIITLIATLVCIGTFYMYVAIFSVARKRKRVRGISQNVIVNGNQVASTIPDATSARHQRAEETLRNTETSQDILLAKACLPIVFTSLLCHLPNAVVLGIWREHVNTIDIIVHLKVWTHSLVLINSTLNCLIFFWANKTLGNEGWKVLKKCFALDRSDDTVTSMVGMSQQERKK